MMRMHDPLWAPDDRTRGGHGDSTSGGAESIVPPGESSPADLAKPGAESGLPPTETPPETEMGGQHISGPGPYDLTRGLP